MPKNEVNFNASFEEKDEKKLKALTNRKLIRSHQGKNTVTCECGAEILLLPDVKAMDQAIEAHIAAVHMQKSKDSKCGTMEAERVRDALTEQVLCKASKSENERSHKEGN